MPGTRKAGHSLVTRRTPEDNGEATYSTADHTLIIGREGTESAGARTAAAVDARARRRAAHDDQCAPKIGAVSAAKGWAAVASRK